MSGVWIEKAPPMGMWHSRLGCGLRRPESPTSSNPGCAARSRGTRVRAFGLESQTRVRFIARGVGQVEDAPWRESPTSHTAGFTLVEVLAAVAILGSALFILLSTHHTSLLLFDQMNVSVVQRQLLERAVGEAEFGVFTGELSGGGEFNGRYAGYTWSYQGTTTGGAKDTPMPLYQVDVTLRTPDNEEESLTFFVFDIGSNEVLEGKP